MAILVEINKVFEEKNIGCYQVSIGQDPEFYMSINKTKKIVSFYSSKNCINPIKTIDLKNEKQIIGTLPGFNSVAYSRALIQAVKVIDTNNFPDSLDYAA